MKQHKRNILVIAAAILTLLLLAACAAPAIPEATAAPTQAATATPPPTATPAPIVTPTSAPTETLALTATPTVTAAATPTTTPKGPTMYTSYADLISFDPETGIAKFDYFDMLRGDDAVKFLVDHDGYTQAKAQELVDNFADSEYVKKNTNPQLRAIDIDDVPLKLMVKPNGDPVDGAEPKSVTAAQFRAVYALNTSLLLESYFYHITVDSGGKVTLVEQVYWP
ncbi:MAG TPA: hypothetical protein VN538_12800 [Clostridia bacterium]|nr:hypothetical protein [Clostridia bacterium]